MSNNKYLVKCIFYSELLRSYSIALRLFSAQQHSWLSRASPTPDSKIDMFAWLSDIYRWKIYLRHVSYALRKTQRLKFIK